MDTIVAFPCGGLHFHVRPRVALILWRREEDLVFVIVPAFAQR